jgi:hypothetical protein
MASWQGWQVDRTVLLFSAVLYLGIWIQVSLYHWAGGFKMRIMWAPVILTPLVAAGVAAGVVTRQSVWGYTAAALLALATASGLVGLYYHIQGIRSQIGGVSVRNVLSGPPPMLPLAYSLTGALGLVALLWNA